ncbi:MAG: sirohydrochlorin cobaltochelatase [Lentisphaerota bacterium]
MNGISNSVILLIAHGATTESSWLSYRNIERVVKVAFPLSPVRWAFTAPDTVSETIQAIQAEGFSGIAVQPLFVAAGLEYNSVLSSVESLQRLNMRISVGRPLLDSVDDLDRFIEVLINVLPLERTTDEAIVLMGHNNADGCSDQIFNALADALKQRDRLIFTATLKGALDFDSVRRELTVCGVRKAYLLPLLIAAGNHALKDLAGGGEAAWRVRLERDGIKCATALKGLGEYDSFASIFCDKLKAQNL